MCFNAFLMYYSYACFQIGAQDKFIKCTWFLCFAGMLQGTAVFWKISVSG